MILDMSFNNERINILKKLTKNEGIINYNDLFFKTANSSDNNFDFEKRFGILFDLLIDLLNEKIIINKAKQEQEQMIGKINKLNDFILLEEESIKSIVKVFLQHRIVL